MRRSSCTGPKVMIVSAFRRGSDRPSDSICESIDSPFSLILYPKAMENPSLQLVKSLVMALERRSFAAVLLSAAVVGCGGGPPAVAPPSSGTLSKPAMEVRANTASSLKHSAPATFPENRLIDAPQHQATASSTTAAQPDRRSISHELGEADDITPPTSTPTSSYPGSEDGPEGGDS